MAAAAVPQKRRRLTIRAQRSETGTHFFRKHFRLLPRRKMSAFGEFVEMDEFEIRLFRPTSRSLIELVGKDADGCRNRYALNIEKTELVFPIQARRRNAGIR